jgi:hypothetical protein
MSTRRQTPCRLNARARSDASTGPFALVEHLHVSAERDRREDPLGRVAAAPPDEQRLAEADREAQHLDVADARSEVMAVFVHDDQDAERDDECGDRVQQVHAAFPKSAPAHSAAARPRAPIGIEQRFERFARCGRYALQSLVDHVRNRGEAKPSRQKRLDCDFIGRIQHGRYGATGTQRGVRQAQARKAVRLRVLERQASDRCEIERANAGFDSFRVGERVRDRDPHVRIRKLRDHRSVDVLDQRMHDALRMDQDLDPLGRQVEQPARFDYFESLVHHRRRVDGDLAAHDPVRVRAGFVGRDADGAVERRGAERTAGRREQHAAHPTSLVRRHALEHRVVLAIDRQQQRSDSRTAP